MANTLRDDWVSLKQAAQQLDENAETTRLRIGRGELRGEQRGRGGRWFVEPQSLANLVSARGGSQRPEARIGSLESKIDQLTSAVEQLRSDMQGLRSDPIEQRVDLETLARERDRYRAEASTLREAAIRANAGQRSMAEGFRKVLDAVDENANALSELLGPQSPADVGSHSGVEAD